MWDRLTDIVAKIMATDALQAVRPSNIASKLSALYGGMKGSGLNFGRETADMIDAIKGIPRDLLDRVKAIAKEIDRQMFLNPTTRGPWFSFRAWQGQISAQLSAAMSAAVAGLAGIVRTTFASAGAKFRSMNFNIPGLSRVGIALGGIPRRLWGMIQAIDKNPYVIAAARLMGHGIGSAIRFPFAVAGQAANALPSAGRALLRGTGRAVGLVAPRLGGKLIAAGAMTGVAGATAGLGALATAAVALPPILKAWSQSIIESHRAISQYNGGIAGAMAKADVAGIMRQIQSGSAVQASTIRSIEAQTKFLDALQGPLDVLTIVGNNVLATMADIGTAVVEGSKKIVELAKDLKKVPFMAQVAEAILKIMEKKENADVNQMVPILNEYKEMANQQGNAPVWKPNREPLPPVK